MKDQRLLLGGLCLLCVLYFGVARQWISRSMRDKDFSEYATRLVQSSAADYREPKEVRVLLLVKAEQLELPITNDAIKIAGIGRTLRVGVHYEDDIRLPILNQRLYRMKFAHNFNSGSLQ
jgi:hypothetical protein